MSHEQPESRLYIVNFQSGGGRTARRWPRIREAIESRGIGGDITVTEAPGGGYDLAANGVDAGYDTIIAVGGDGTVFEVANAIFDRQADPGVRLGTIPVGTGKDVARCLDIPRPGPAMRAIADGVERRIDVGRVDAVDGAGRAIVRHFLLEASAGWVPEVSGSVPRQLKRLGDTAPYVIMAVAKLAGPMARDFVVQLDDAFYDGRYNTISVHNMEYWGGDLRAAPGAEPDDGVFDVIRWGDLGRGAVLKSVQGQKDGGRHLETDGIDHHQVRSVSLASGKRTSIDLDGERGGYLPAKISVVPSALRFIAPPPSGAS
ncbi:MAG: YegS/Rv2252/BmrU family lipid kinase [Dehalococcoidia bacterium]|nr:YegS/Rv2252/BmrU family lipid kinase [Dehalococcoidia bacterium]